jgi:hypothetical protein
MGIIFAIILQILKEKTVAFIVVYLLQLNFKVNNL